MATTTVVPSATVTGRRVTTSTRKPKRSLRRTVIDNLTGHTFLIGAIICFGFFSWYPMVREFIMSFQRTHRGVTSWVGWANYIRIWHDPSFVIAWRNTANSRCSR